MLNFDLTVSISVILALAAIISPILTALINNRHHTKIRKMEMQQQTYENTILHKRTVFENYLKVAGKCIYYSDTSSLKEYGEFYFHALMYAPPELRNDMIAANQKMQNYDWEEASEIIEKISAKISDNLQPM